MNVSSQRFFLSCAVALVVSSVAVPALADSLEGALVRAYKSNPDLASSRAALRIADETVPSALSGYRPSISATASAGSSITQPYPTYRDNYLTPRSAGIQGQQVIYDGNKTANNVRNADQNVMISREDLRNKEQTILLSSATAYMNVLRDQATLELQNRNVEVLQEQLRFTKDRFAVGEVTRTDVAQSESRLQAAISQVSVAQANLANSRAVYRQMIGVDPAARLTAARTAERLLPKSLPAAVEAGLKNHPSIKGAEHGADAASIQVRIAEAALYPTLSVTGSVTQAVQQSLSSPNDAIVYSALANLTVPIFANGGRDYASIRSAKETVGQRLVQVDIARESVRQAVVQSWGALEAARAQIKAGEAQVNAAEIALKGIREEAKVGQRTTLDVLNAQQELTNARVSLVSSQRDRVVQSYSVLSATGSLNVNRLGLKTEVYNPTVHYDQTRDRWFGLRTPDGR